MRNVVKRYHYIVTWKMMQGTLKIIILYIEILTLLPPYKNDFT